MAVLLSIEIFSTVFFQTARSSIINRTLPISTSVSRSSKYVRGLLRRQTCGRRPCLEKGLLCIQHVQLELLLCRQKGYQIKVFLPKGRKTWLLRWPGIRPSHSSLKSELFCGLGRRLGEEGHHRFDQVSDVSFNVSSWRGVSCSSHLNLFLVLCSVSNSLMKTEEQARLTPWNTIPYLLGDTLFCCQQCRQVVAHDKPSAASKVLDHKEVSRHILWFWIEVQKYSSEQLLSVAVVVFDLK